jgi:uncharacterized protein YjiS (DUF1127 family)
METDMSANYPVLPVAGGAVLRALASLLALVTYWLKQLARARRHRREAAKLAGLDRRMLADIGLSRADLRDAFSEPFWEDPTALLNDRASGRRLNRRALHPLPAPSVQSAFRRPPMDRPARLGI